MTTDTLAKLAAELAQLASEGPALIHLQSGAYICRKLGESAKALAAQALPAAGRCDECGKDQAEGWALYCVDCLEKTGLLAKEALPHTQHVSSTAADLTGPNDTAMQAPTLTDHDIETLAHRMCWRYKKSSDPHHSDTYTFNRTCLLDFVRKTMQGEIK